MYTALSFTDPPPEGATPSTSCNSISLELLKLSVTHFLLMVFVQETNRCCQKYYAAKSGSKAAPEDVALEETFISLVLILKVGHNKRLCRFICDTAVKHL
jgi:hypothetical protein